MGIASVRCDVTSSRPASLARMVSGEFVGVALCTQAASPRGQHRRVLRSVCLMALVTAASTESCYGIVFVYKGSSLIRMACNALALEGGLAYLR